MTSELWTRENLAWCAGIVEGEGYIGVRRTGTKGSLSLVVSIEMSDQDVILRFAKYIGMGTVAGPFRRNSPAHHKPTWTYGVYGYQAYGLLIAILPWLCQRRQAKALSGIKEWLERPGRGVTSRKLTDDQVRSVRHAVNVDGRTIRSVADEFNSNHHSIMQIARGIYYKTVSNFTS